MNTFIKITSTILVCTLTSGCVHCLTKTTIAGDVSASPTGDSIGTISPNITFEFDTKCCPDKESVKIVHELEKLSLELAKKYSASEIDKNTYDEKHGNIKKLMKELKTTCAKITDPNSASAPSTNTIWSRMSDFTENTRKLIY